MKIQVESSSEDAVLHGFHFTPGAALLRFSGSEQRYGVCVAVPCRFQPEPK
jgi:hypothetical protein